MCKAWLVPFIANQNSGVSKRFIIQRNPESGIFSMSVLDRIGIIGILDMAEQKGRHEAQ
jgi:hypothetical protein